jgi:predicted dehydrogenase
VDINGVAIMKFANGALGNVAIGGSCPTNMRYEIQIQTDRMVVLTDQYSSKLEMYGLEGRRIYPHVENDDHLAAGTPHLNFINALLGKEPLRAPVRYGVLLSALMDALYESADKKRPVQVKPVPKDI